MAAKPGRGTTRQREAGAASREMVVMGPESYDLLVRQTGYSLDRFERWTADTLIAALLEPGHE